MNSVWAKEIGRWATEASQRLQVRPAPRRQPERAHRHLHREHRQRRALRELHDRRPSDQQEHASPDLGVLRVRQRLQARRVHERCQRARGPQGDRGARVLPRDPVRLRHLRGPAFMEGTGPGWRRGLHRRQRQRPVPAAGKPDGSRQQCIARAVDLTRRRQAVHPVRHVDLVPVPDRAPQRRDHKQIWVKSVGKANYSFKSIAAILVARGTTLNTMLAQFGSWNAAPAAFYTEGVRYPTAGAIPGRDGTAGRTWTPVTDSHAARSSTSRTTISSSLPARYVRQFPDRHDQLTVGVRAATAIQLAATGAITPIPIVLNATGRATVADTPFDAGVSKMVVVVAMPATGSSATGHDLSCSGNPRSTIT